MKTISCNNKLMFHARFAGRLRSLAVALSDASRSMLAVLVFFLVTGCGYHFQGGGRPQGLTIRSLAIPLMESSSSELGFESDFTKVVRCQFIRYGDIPLVSRNEADMVLIAKIYDISTDPLTYNVTHTRVEDKTTDYEITDSRRLKVRMEARLIQRSTGRVVWEDKGLVEKERYLVTEDPLTNRYNRKSALRKIARRLADRIYLKTMERF